MRCYVPQDLLDPGRLSASGLSSLLATLQQSFGALGFLGKPVDGISIVANLDKSWLPPSLMAGRYKPSEAR